MLVEIVKLLPINPELARSGANLIEKLLGKPCEVVGELLGDQIYFWQWQNRLRIAARANQILEKNKLAAKITPPSFLLPLLDAAGNVDDETLSEMWSHLLASGISAASHRHPAYVQLLKQMSSDEARSLAHIANSGGSVNLPSDEYAAVEDRLEQASSSTEEAILEEFGYCILEFDNPFLVLDRLQTMGLIQVNADHFPYEWRHGNIPHAPVNRKLCLSDWGQSFVNACISSQHDDVNKS
ncbi:Abi-alpha family protein [Planctomicrobium sp. SH527]|uniref:Abi-alpha family protein n=1 Tax=Planctomicrobium sp. SH527 TaxID=3448123 RepID=UPI003F5C33C1